MAWRRVNHPTEILQIGQSVKVQIIRINQEKPTAFALGMKQLEADPWEASASSTRYGREGLRPRHEHHGLRRLRRAGAGIEGLIHVSEMSWTKKNVHPGKILSTSQEVEVVVLEVDPVKRRISLASSRRSRTPGKAFRDQFPVGTIVEARSRTRPSSVCSSASRATWTAWFTCPTSTWSRPGEQVIDEFNKGDTVRAQVLDVDVEKERISLGIKQVGGDSFAQAAEAGDLRRGAIVTCEVTSVNEGGIECRSRTPSSRPSSAATTSAATATTSARRSSPSARRSMPA